MKKYKRKFVWQKYFYSIFTIVVLIIIIVFITRSFIIEYNKYLFTKKEYNFSVSQRLEAENKLNQNNLKVSEIKTNDGKERYIREAYPVKKIGEEMIVVYDTPNITYNIPKAPSKWSAFKEYVKELFGLKN